MGASIKTWLGPVRDRAGFTVVEVLVVVGIMAALAAGSFGLLSIDEDSRFESQAQSLLSVTREMQSNARTVRNNLEYGVSFTGNTWSTFSYDPATSAQTNLETRQLANINLSTSFNPTATQIRFTRLTGQLANGTSGPITLQETRKPSRTIVIKVESTGVLYVQ